MIQTDIRVLNELNKPARSIKGKVELYEGSTLLDTFTHDGALQGFEIERIGAENKFFGFGVSKKITLKLLDRERAINLVKGQILKIYLTAGGVETSPYPKFFIEDIDRDENTNNLEVVAYDIIHNADKYTVSNMTIPTDYTIEEFARAAGAVLNVPVKTKKNLWDNNNYITNLSSAYITRTDTGFNFTRDNYTYGTDVSMKLSVKAGETYTFSYNQSGQGALYLYKDAVYGTTIKSTTNDFITHTFTEDAVVYFTIIISSALASLNATNIQIEKSAAVTAYEPYMAVFNTEYPTGANFEGTEDLREALDDIAEATQTIYYVNNNNELVFKKIDIEGDPVLHIDKSKYFKLKSGGNYTITKVVHTTQLGDNIEPATSSPGATQYVRDNAFWELRDDIANIVEAANAAINGLTFNSYDIKYRGNFLLEPGDKISMAAKDNTVITSYVINGSLTYNGGLVETLTLEFTSDETETAANPSTLGESLKQTFAKVDKANKEITLLVSETDELNQKVSSLELDTEGISAIVTDVERRMEEGFGGIDNEIETLTRKVEASITAEDVKIEIETALKNSEVTEVTTTTGFTFNESGLHVAKSGSEMTTTISEDGMIVYRDEQEVLTANNIGVNATNLHATTYLSVGANSRFEDYSEHRRTGCFWIGSIS